MHRVEITIGYEITDHATYETNPPITDGKREAWRKLAYDHTLADAAAIANLARTLHYQEPPSTATLETQLQAALGTGFHANLATKKREHVYVGGEWVCETSYRLQIETGNPAPNEWADIDTPFPIDDAPDPDTVLTAHYRVGTREKHDWDGA